MYMSDWVQKLDAFIRFNEKEVLTHAGEVSHVEMQHKVKNELAKYNERVADEQKSPTQPRLLPDVADDPKTDNSK